MDFAKYHAMGNDYLVVDPSWTKIDGNDAKLLCDRRVGIGADGVLCGPSDAEIGSPVELRIFNSDGSVCERSANGIRIFALHLFTLHQHELGGSERDFIIRTSSGETLVQICNFDLGVVRINMGQPRFLQRRVALELADEVVLVNTVHNGNPHAVMFCEEVSPELARRLGESVAGHVAFDDRVNVHFARVVDRATIELQIWERGAGYTLASGAGACAVASSAHDMGFVDERVQVRMPGGAVEVSISGAGEVAMLGVVEPVATGSFAPPLRRRLGL